MDHDLAGLLDNPKVRLSQPQIKTYLKQLLEGTAYLHHVKYYINRVFILNSLLNVLFFVRLYNRIKSCIVI